MNLSGWTFHIQGILMCLDYQTGKGTVVCCLSRLHSCTGSDCQLLSNVTVNKAVSEQFEIAALCDSSSVVETHFTSCQSWKAHLFFQCLRLSWFNLLGSSAHQFAQATLSPVRQGRETRKIKVWEFVCWDKDNLIRKEEEKKKWFTMLTTSRLMPKSLSNASSHGQFPPLLLFNMMSHGME